MKSTHSYKKVVPLLVVFLMFILVIPIFSIQISPVVAQDSTAYLTRTISDQVIDTNNDGLYDELLIGIEVNVTSPGTFVVEVFGFYDESANYVDVSNKNSTYLQTGIHVVYVSLDGASLYLSGVNFNKVAIVTLYDESQNTIHEVFDLSLSKTYSFIDFQDVPATFSFDEITREIILDQTGNIYVTNIYSITNRAAWASTFNIGFPEDAYDFEVRDAMGTLEAITENGMFAITLRKIIDMNETETIYVNYYLQWENQVSQQNGIDFTLSFTFYEQFNSTINTLTDYITLPKGASFISSTIQSPDSVKETDLQETLTFSFNDVSPSDDLNFTIHYEYNVFWGSFYPTLWVGILAVGASVILFFLGTPKTISASILLVPTKDIKSFVDTYEEKMTVQSELESLEERMKKGKIPRRRYKVRKKMLDSRLSKISRNLSAIRGTIRASSSKYRRMMDQLEVAEAKLESSERDIQRVNSRYSRGEISKAVYGKLLDEYQSQTVAAEGTIDGILLRLND